MHILVVLGTQGHESYNINYISNRGKIRTESEKTLRTHLHTTKLFLP